jgi:hypothetical protein
MPPAAEPASNLIGLAPGQFSAPDAAYATDIELVSKTTIGVMIRRAMRPSAFVEHSRNVYNGPKIGCKHARKSHESFVDFE